MAAARLESTSDQRGAVDRASAAIRPLGPLDDQLFPVAVLRGRSILGLDHDERELLAFWAPGVTREIGSIRYRWAINPRFAGPSPSWVGRPMEWRPWRAKDVAAWNDRPDRSTQDIERLITPLVLSDSLELLVQASRREDEVGDLARSFLEEALPKARRDASAWVQELRAWADTWALWAMARRPGSLTTLYPFALAIATSYAASAVRNGNVVLGTRFPFHGVPLASGGAQLAVGLVALGVHQNLAGELADRVRSQQHADGGWGDGDGESDVLTTLVAAGLLASVDPTYDPAPTARWFAVAQRADGWWRACGPESTWLTVEILAWLLEADRPFSKRFKWPHLAVTNRDRRTGLPFYEYFSELERLFEAVPGLSDATVDIAFVDLAGFGVFNNAFGMEMGDRVLRTFAQALARIPGSMAIRDGGDEFIVVGTPTGVGLPSRMTAFRDAWAVEFAETYGDSAVAPRVLTMTTRGAGIVDARNLLGKRIAQLKQDVPTVGPTGIQRDLGSDA
jgi:GGDEF domain-containing protein